MYRIHFGSSVTHADQIEFKRIKNQLHGGLSCAGGKKTLLATMRAVALSFGMVLTCNRDSSDKDVVVNFRKLALRVHPGPVANVLSPSLLMFCHLFTVLRPVAHVQSPFHGATMPDVAPRDFDGAACAVQKKRLPLAWGRCLGDSAEGNHHIVNKTQPKQRILAICRSPKSKTVAANIFQSFRKVCKEVLQKRGAMARC